MVVVVFLVLVLVVIAGAGQVHLAGEAELVVDRRENNKNWP